MRTIPTQYPDDTSQRGTLQMAGLRSPPQFDVRPPDLKSPPMVSALGAGLGTGAGAFVRNNGSDADQAQGLVIIRAGSNPTAGPYTLTLTFPAGVAGGQYVFFADWATCAAGAPSGNNITITLTATRAVLPNERLHFAYQWAVSR